MVVSNNSHGVRIARITFYICLIWGRTRNYSAKVHYCVILCHWLPRIQFLYLWFLYPSFPFRYVISGFISGIYIFYFYFSLLIFFCIHTNADMCLWTLKFFLLFCTKLFGMQLVKQRAGLWVFSSDSRAHLCTLHLWYFGMSVPLLGRLVHCKVVVALLFSVH